MGQCYGKNASAKKDSRQSETAPRHSYSHSHSHNQTHSHSQSQSQSQSHSQVHFENGTSGNRTTKASFPPSPLPSASPLPKVYTPSLFPSPSPSPARSTPRRFFRRPFPPPSPAKHIQASLIKRYGSAKPKEGPIPEGVEQEKPLEKLFGYSRNFSTKYELGQEVGRGHFGHTCSAKVKKGELKGQTVAVKVIAKAKMTTAIAIEDVKREVKILRALSGHENLVQFYDACEDNHNVYIVMELCEGGELLDRILTRGGRYSEDDAKVIVVQILKIVSFCHLQGVVHRDLKPENFLFLTKDDAAPMKAIDFGLSDLVKPETRLNDIVGSAYYVAPEVLHRSYSMEADVWSIGVIAYILLCGSRPFWARTESGIFRAVIRADPSFDEMPWPSVSPEAKDFVKRLLSKDLRRRMTAAQALTHPWLCGDHKIPLDILVYKLVKAYLRASPLKRAALKALSKTLTEDELVYLRAQYTILEPHKDGCVTLENFRMALMKNATEAMKEAKVFDILNSMDALAFKKLDFQEFCAAAISVHQLEALQRWEQYARTAYEYFERDGNRVIKVEELAQEVGLSATVPAHVVFHDWVRHTDGRLSFTGFTKLLHGVTPRFNTRPQ